MYKYTHRVLIHFYSTGLATLPSRPTSHLTTTKENNEKQKQKTSKQTDMRNFLLSCQGLSKRVLNIQPNAVALVPHQR